MSAKEQLAEQMAKATRITVVQPGQPLAKLVDALRARDWKGAAAQLDGLTRQMGLNMTQDERQEFALAVIAEMETAPLLDSGPPSPQALAKLPTEAEPV